MACHIRHARGHKISVHLFVYFFVQPLPLHIKKLSNQTWHTGTQLAPEGFYLDQILWQHHVVW